MQNVFIRSGHGYEESDRGRCTAFDDFEVIRRRVAELVEAERLIIDRYADEIRASIDA